MERGHELQGPMNEVLALAAISLTASSGVLAAVVGFRTRLGDKVFTWLMLFGSTAGLVSAVRSLAGIAGTPWNRPWSVPGGVLELEVDALSALFLAQIFLIGALGAIYGFGYWRADEKPGTIGKLRAFYGLMVAGMALLVVARNSVLFLAGWEIMAIAAFFSITTDDDDLEVRQSGFVYLVATRIGTLFVFATFAVLRSATGSFSLSIANLDGTLGRAAAVFLLGLAGFGLKAGLMPLHVWLPGAHANAPSHVSALMSGVLIKMGIYGLIRVVSFFDAIPVWWGLLLFALGGVSAVLGVVFAIGQHDLKRLLAYHSVENIGIIVMGLGIALLGRATGHEPLVALGLAGALLHTWNHGLFKSLLFLSAGSVIHATHTREIDKLGGLAKRLPLSSFAFLVGAIAICGLPPLNGFVSELFVFLGMLRAGALDMGSISIAAVLGVPVLAMVGGLAALCFAKVFSVVFLGEPRSAGARAGYESPRTMVGPMLVLAGSCALIGALPPLISPVLERATSAWLGGGGAGSLRALAPLVPVGWVNALLAAFILAAAVLTQRSAAPAHAARGPTWGCGYPAPSARMQYTASSFGEWIVGMFRVVLRPRTHFSLRVDPFPASSHFESHVPEVVLDLGILPASRGLGRIALWFRWVQQGQVQLYVLYVLGALLFMLFIWR
jgi:hydrogenase-4 component B